MPVLVSIYSQGAISITIDLIRDLTSDQRERRKKAAKALAIMDNRDAVPHLMAALTAEPRLDVAIEIVKGLGELSDARAIPVLLEIVPIASKWRTGYAAAMLTHQLQFTEIPNALAKIGDLSAMLEWRGHDDGNIRRAVNTAIDRLSEYHRLSELL